MIMARQAMFMLSQMAIMNGVLLLIAHADRH